MLSKILVFTSMVAFAAHGPVMAATVEAGTGQPLLPVSPQTDSKAARDTEPQAGQAREFAAPLEQAAQGSEVAATGADAAGTDTAPAPVSSPEPAPAAEATVAEPQAKPAAAPPAREQASMTTYPASGGVTAWRDYMAENYDAFLKRAEERQQKLAEHYEALRKRAEEQELYLNQRYEQMLMRAMEQHAERIRENEELRKRAEERRDRLARLRSAMQDMTLDQRKAYLAEHYEEMFEGGDVRRWPGSSSWPHGGGMGWGPPAGSPMGQGSGMGPGPGMGYGPPRLDYGGYPPDQPPAP